MFESPLNTTHNIAQNVDPSSLQKGENILKKYHSKARKHFHNVVKVVVNGEEHNLVKNKYCDFLREWGLREEICIAELPQKVMPFIVDFVFHFKTEDEDCEFFNDDSLIDEFRSICNDVLEKNFRLPDKKRLLLCAYLESDTWETNVETRNLEGTQLYCMKVRLHFPYCPIEGKLQEEIVIPLIVQQLEESQYILRFFSIEPFYTWKDIVQSPVHEPLELYGSAPKASPDADGSVQKGGKPPLKYKGRYGPGAITLNTDPDMPLEKLLFLFSVMTLDVSEALIIRSTRARGRVAVDDSAPTTLAQAGFTESLLTNSRKKSKKRQIKHANRMAIETSDCGWGIILNLFIELRRENGCSLQNGIKPQNCGSLKKIIVNWWMVWRNTESSS